MFSSSSSNKDYQTLQAEYVDTEDERNGIDYFERVYALSSTFRKTKNAIQSDREKLKELIASEQCFIDVHRGFFSPVTRLALAGDELGVKYLLNELNASKRQAILGYAIAGNVSRVDSLLEEIKKQLTSKRQNNIDSDFEYQRAVDQSLLGYAIGNHHEQVSFLLQNNFSYMAIRGYAYNENIGRVENLLSTPHLLEKETSGYKNYCRKMEEAVHGYALIGNAEANKILRNNSETNGFHLPIFERAIFAYASANNTAAVNQLITKLSEQSQNKKERYIQLAIEGYGRSGYASSLETLLNLHGLSEIQKWRNVAVYALAYGGYQHSTQKWLKLGANLEEAEKGYRDGDHHYVVTQSDCCFRISQR